MLGQQPVVSGRRHGRHRLCGQTGIVLEHPPTDGKPGRHVIVSVGHTGQRDETIGRRLRITIGGIGAGKLVHRSQVISKPCPAAEPVEAGDHELGVRSLEPAQVVLTERTMAGMKLLDHVEGSPVTGTDKLLHKLRLLLEMLQ
jgi:hypothetical protein